MSLAQRNDCQHNSKEILEGNDKIACRDLALGILFLSQTVIGILGNFSLLYHYVFLHHRQSRLRFIDLILMHLCIANSLVILSNGSSQTIVAFGSKYLFNEFGCHVTLYVFRVGTTMSICSVCFLSVFQTIIISPTNSCWKYHKIKSPKYIGFIISFCWLLHMGVNFIFPLYMLHASGKLESRNITKERHLGFCAVVDYGTTMNSVYIALVVLPEVSLIVLTIWASGSTIFVLYRHKQQVKHIHCTNVSLRSPELRATKSILLLASTFVTFYIISSIFHSFIALFYNLSWWLVNISCLISLCFPTISPFLVMSQDSSISVFWFVWIRNTKHLFSAEIYNCIFSRSFVLCTPQFIMKGTT
ncbi:PREDICTED: vomeronasal type-1 receptor 4-like [Chinchilla lanigera]|uniref:vomeronasal type-1 receptor 4-like n=1 Tax=Chinchilla lanigera TaxID=34839 RepID=UPI00038EFFDD|nr:PREDICTED: vomeronasal type-1 receptor 4-like [Chinchilla lanigera]